MTSRFTYQWLVAIGIVAVLFCLVPSAAAAKAAVLSLSASPAVVDAGGQVTLKGNLTDASTGALIPLQRITLQVSSDGVTWTDQWSTLGRTGQFEVSQVMNSPGTFYFRAYSPASRTYTAATSPPVVVTVRPLPGPAASALSIRALPQSVTVGATVTISGALTSVQGGKGIPGQPITLQHSADGITFSTLGIVATAPNGSYSTSVLLNTPGKVSFKALFAGNGSFSGSTSPVVTVDVAAPSLKGTALALRASSGTITLGQQVNLTGTLKESPSGRNIPEGLVTVQVSRDGGAWDLLGQKITDSRGEILVSHTPTAAGNYQYRALYAGNSTYASSQSTSVAVTVRDLPAAPGTTLSLAASPAAPTRAEPYTVSGTLRDASTGKGIDAKVVRVERSPDGAAWSSIGLLSTKMGGNFSISQSQSDGGTFFYRATFAGDRSYQGSTSPVLKVVVKRAASLAFTASPVVIAPGGTITCSGRLTDDRSGTGLAGETVRVMLSRGNTAWTVFGTAVTEADGTWRLSGTIANTGSYVLAGQFEGSSLYDAAWSNSVGIRVS